MSSDNEDHSVKDTSSVAKPPYEATPKDASFFFSVLKNCKSKPDVDWDAVAAEQGLKSAGVAKVRYGQIKNKCGMTAIPPGTKSTPKEPKTPTKRKATTKAGGSAKMAKTDGGEDDEGAVATPTKSPKKRATPKKAPKSAVKAEADEDEDMDAGSGDDVKPVGTKFAKASVKDEEDNMEEEI
ncbi:hypothetical protein GLAREA_05575 [Glarea lozoyensis ATCC 20868]|uniref:Myb-like DNA-binding domain-containing protein n=1 Tax=Glarea lozoyensis (strain ATCC 20868 / MF5171) TaxID=1116229 RepID=S3DCV7_GLAL2|nr:uncharacterized protein GLAREA_05575 [Glarea lozoyensis ATCC 20868]EPE36237.1 hypothetical protein GLAREA_05575 [Glarea lozoyensis ATCC 20868]